MLIVSRHPFESIYRQLLQGSNILVRNAQYALSFCLLRIRSFRAVPAQFGALRQRHAVFICQFDQPITQRDALFHPLQNIIIVKIGIRDCTKESVAQEMTNLLLIFRHPRTV